MAFEWLAQPHCYLSSLDNGKFTVSAPRTKGEGPAPEDQIALIRAPDCDWIALKTGYDRYMGVVGEEGLLVATAEAIGAREKWELVFEEGGKCALQSLYNNMFVSFDTDKEGYCHANAKTAKEAEICKVCAWDISAKLSVLQFRTEMERARPVDFSCPTDYKKSGACETDYM